jgi:hypothetical protein
MVFPTPPSNACFKEKCFEIQNCGTILTTFRLLHRCEAAATAIQSKNEPSDVIAMKSLFAPLLALLFAFSLSLTAQAYSNKDTRVYEMRVYYAAPGKLDALNARFRNHTLKLFEKHGMENVGYWMPVNNPDGKLIYVLAYPSREAREKVWKEFMADPDWQKAWKESEVNGKLVAKVETYFMNLTDYSPKVKYPENKSPRVFELRTYTSSPNNLENLNERFRKHTVKLFKKHGMTNIAYWNLLPGEKGADSQLIYILAHKSEEAAKASFDAFRQDKKWEKAKKASEEKGGGSLTADKGLFTAKGVDSVFMVPTDYSPIK